MTTEPSERDAAQAVQRDLDALLKLPTAPRLTIPAKDLAVIIGNQYAQLATRYWAARTQAEVCSIVGDHAEAKSCFEQAKKIVDKIAMVRQVALDHGVAEDYDRLVAAFLSEPKAAPQPAVKAA